MLTYGFLKSGLASSLLTVFAVAADLPPPRKHAASAPPNVLLIMADDLGYGDLGCYGGNRLRTPNLDALAASGARFTDFYVTAPRCTPSRGSLLTGRYPQRNGLTGLIWPEDAYGLSPRETTLAELLRGQGYTTGLIGKWHLGHAQPEFLPMAHGFQSWYGMAYPTDMDGRHPRSIQNKLNWPPLALQRGTEIVEQPVKLDLLTEKYTAESVRFITEHKDHPWFLFYASHVPHTYLAASESFRGKSRGGLYGDMVEEFDDSVGQLVAVLKSTGQLDRTLIVFTNDNGASIETAVVTRKRSLNPVYATIDADGSQGSNAPLRGGKNTPYEGGSRVPTFISLPGIIPPGRVIHDPSSLNDLFPTISSFAGVLLPVEVVLDGVDLTPALLGEHPRRPDPIFYDCPRTRAVRVGPWKLVFPGSQWDAAVRTPELYDLEADIGETADLAPKHPELVEVLTARIRDFEAQFTRSVP